MRHIVLLRLSATADPAAMKDHATAEAKIVAEAMADGELRGVMMRGDAPGAVLDIEAPDADAAHRIAALLPFVAKGWLDVEVWSLAPYAQFRLLA